MISDYRLIYLLSIGIGCGVLLRGVQTITRRKIYEMLVGMYDSCTKQASSHDAYDVIISLFIDLWRNHNFMIIYKMKLE